MAIEKSTILDGSLEEIIKRIDALAPEESKAEDYQQIFDGEHEILKRPDKIKKTEKGESATLVAKIVLDYQEDIVESAVAFLFGAPVSLSKKSEGGDEAFQVLDDTLDEIYFNSRNKELARKLFVQCRAAKLYYIKNPDGPKEEQSIASMILSQESGDFIPVFEGGSMTAFLRKYKVNKIVDGKPKKVEMCELYTAEKIVYGEKTDSGWDEKPIANPFKKIPVVYYEQKKPEWEKVKSIIDTQENSYSKLVDTNDYFAKPKLMVSGRVSNMPDKGEVGELLEMEIIEASDGSKVKSEAGYLTWDQRPKSLKLQFDMAEAFIYKFTRTADVNFLNMSKASLGNLSGEALQLLFLSPIIKSLNKQELFDEMLKREISIIMSMLSIMSAANEKDFKEMKIALKFNSIMPDNITEVIENLSVSIASGTMSEETGTELHPMVDNVVRERERINAGKKQKPLDSISGPEE